VGTEREIQRPRHLHVIPILRRSNLLPWGNFATNFQCFGSVFPTNASMT